MSLEEPTFAVVLLVEDDDALQAVREAGLSDAGFKVIAVNNGRAAPEEIEANGSHLRAVITHSREDVGRNFRDLAALLKVFPPTGRKRLRMALLRRHQQIRLTERSRGVGKYPLEY